MSEPVTKSVAHELREQKIETRSAAERVAGFTVVVLAIVAAVAVFALLGAAALFPQGQ
jgi:hypothetical protein